MTTPTFDMRGGNGPTRVMAIERMSSPRSASLMACTAGLKRSTWPIISVDAGGARGGDDVTALLDRGRDRLLDHHMHAALDAGERDVAMQMRRRGDRDRVDTAVEQLRERRVRSGQPSARPTKSACAWSGSATPTSFTPGNSASTRAWLEPMTPIPTTPTRSCRSRSRSRFISDCAIPTPYSPAVVPLTRPEPAGDRGVRTRVNTI